MREGLGAWRVVGGVVSGVLAALVMSGCEDPEATVIYWDNSAPQPAQRFDQGGYTEFDQGGGGVVDSGGGGGGSWPPAIGEAPPLNAPIAQVPCSLMETRDFTLYDDQPNQTFSMGVLSCAMPPSDSLGFGWNNTLTGTLFYRVKEGAQDQAAWIELQGTPNGETPGDYLIDAQAIPLTATVLEVYVPQAEAASTFFLYVSNLAEEAGG